MNKSNESPQRPPDADSAPATSIWSDWTSRMGALSAFVAPRLDHYYAQLPSIHPGHVCVMASLPFCLQAYRGYRKPLEPMVQEILNAKSSSGMSGGAAATRTLRIQDLKGAEEHVRRSVGSAVALRALRVATMGSIGGFGMALAVVFYSLGCTTTHDAMQTTRRWAHAGRKRLDAYFHIDRVDCDHPEVRLMQDMTEEQELEHVSKTYFPNEDWESEVPVGAAAIPAADTSESATR